MQKNAVVPLRIRLHISMVPCIYPGIIVIKHPPTNYFIIQVLDFTVDVLFSQGKVSSISLTVLICKFPDTGGSCSADEYTCRDGGCIDSRLRCDRQYDCNDGSDEENCASQLCFVTFLF